MHNVYEQTAQSMCIVHILSLFVSPFPLVYVHVCVCTFLGVCVGAWVNQPNGLDDFKYTALHLACKKNNQKCVEVLISASKVLMSCSFIPRLQ